MLLSHHHNTNRLKLARRFLLPLMAWCIVFMAAYAPAQPLPTDPRIVTGKLDNGLTYYVMRHANPPGRAVVWMHVFSGSLNETDKQRGVAHYLEHMAFNGSEHFPPGTVVKEFEQLGLTFGRHQNAFTSFDQTTYQLALPDNSPEKLAKALLFMADVNSRLLLDEKEIESERQIILEEKTSRKSSQQRMMEYIYARMAPGSIYGERIPIGTEESIKSLARADFVDYYTKWYGPSNASVIVVADSDPDPVVDAIKAAFSDLAPRPRPTPADAGVKPYEKSFAIVVTDAETTRATVSMTRIGKAHPPVTTRAQLREQFVRNLASTAFRKRIQDKVSEGKSKLSFLAAFAFANNLSGAMWQSQVQASGEPAKWREMFTDLGTEVQRARLHGFTQSEIDAARKDLLASQERRASTEDTFPARAVIQRINGDIASGEPLMSAAQSFELAKALTPDISADECRDWFAAEFDPTTAMFMVQMPALPEAPTTNQLLEFARHAFSVTPEKDAAATRATQLMEKPPTPGKFVEPAEHAPTGIWSAWLDNGVRVHHRFMDYHKNDVTVAITLYGGELLETKDTRGVTLAATQAWSQPATASLSSADIRGLMSGKKVNVGGRTGMDSIQLSVSGDPAELEAGMQLAHLLLTQPRLEQSAFDRWKTAQLQNLEAIEKNPGQKFGTLVAKAVYPDGEVRATLIEKEMIERLTLAHAQEWLNARIADSPIEVAIVGDISRERAMELAAKYLGSLPARLRISPKVYADLRKLERPRGPRTISQTMKTQTELANVLVGFYGPDETNLADVRALSLAAQILTSRMTAQVREEKQLAYSIGTRVNPASVFPGFGLVRAGSPTQPEKAERLAALIDDIFAQFARDGATDEELATAKKQVANNLDEQMKEPGFWLGRMELLTHDAVNLDDVIAGPAAFDAVTKDQIKSAFNKYYNPEAMVRVTLKPEPAPKAGPVASPDPAAK